MSHAPSSLGHPFSYPLYPSYPPFSALDPRLPPHGHPSFPHPYYPHHFPLPYPPSHLPSYPLSHPSASGFYGYGGQVQPLLSHHLPMGIGGAVSHMPGPVPSQLSPDARPFAPVAPTMSAAPPAPPAPLPLSAEGHELLKLLKPTSRKRPAMQEPNGPTKSLSDAEKEDLFRISSDRQKARIGDFKMRRALATHMKLNSDDEVPLKGMDDAPLQSKKRKASSPLRKKRKGLPSISRFDRGESFFPSLPLYLVALTLPSLSAEEENLVRQAAYYSRHRKALEEKEKKKEDNASSECFCLPVFPFSLLSLSFPPHRASQELRWPLPWSCP